MGYRCSEYSQMSSYIPVLEAEELLITTVIPGVLRGLSNREVKGGRVVYSNVVIAKGSYKLQSVWNIHCDVSITKRDNKTQQTPRCCSSVWLASIPRFSDDGLLTLDGSHYHTVMRQRLIPNVPISSSRRVAGNDLVTCRLRSENYETLESSSLTMYRQSRHNKSVVMETSAKGSKPMDVVGYIKHTISTMDWQQVLRHTLMLLDCSNTVMQLVELLMMNVEEIQPVAYILPSTISSSGQHYYVNLMDHELTTEYVIICQMLVKFLKTESGELPVDDVDDYKNKVVDDYANIMGKLFRKLVMKSGVYIANVGVADSPKLYDKFVDAFTYNKWEVIDDYDSKLQISRIVEHTSPNCIQAALQEVIILSGSHTSADSIGDTYNVRMIHPSQQGFICLIRTSDDVSAGMKLYLAADCRVSHTLYTFGESYDDDNIKLRSMLSGANGKLWIHNGHIVGYVEQREAVAILEHIKSIKPSVSYSVGDIVESRDYYGRLMCEITLDGNVRTMVDAREMSRVSHRITTKPSNYSSLCHEIPYMNRMPVARTMLSTKIMQKCISAHMPNDASVDYSYLTCSQDPLVRTSRSSSYCYGNNAVVCYTTHKGMGIEDGIVMNKSAVDRGLFMMVRKHSIDWYSSDKWNILEYVVNAKINSEVREGHILATVTYQTEDGNTVTGKIKHDKPYKCKVENIELTFDTGNNRTYGVVSPKFLTNISIHMIRCKRFRTGDKLSSRSAQKAVAVSVVNECDMPVIMYQHRKSGSKHMCELPSTVDMIINPLSIISRCTVSQDVSSALGMIATEAGAVFVDHQFSYTEICYRRYNSTSGKEIASSSRFNVDGDTFNRVTLMDGCTGNVYDGEAVVGIEYYMVLNHVADTKTRSNSSITRDGMTGGITRRNQETQVRYNWQELAAMMHSQAYSLASTIYNNTGDLGYYPYCNSCNRDVDATTDGYCEYCGLEISARVSASRSFMSSRRVAQALGSDVYISCNDEKSG